MIHYRKADRSDVEQLASLLSELFAIEKDFSIDPGKQQRGLQLLLGAEQAAVFCACSDAQVVGMVTGQLLVSTAEGAHSLLLEDLVVQQKFRGRGIGSALLEHITRWGAQNGAGRMQLLADRNNQPGLSFYAAKQWSTTDLICLRKYNRQEEP